MAEQKRRLKAGVIRADVKIGNEKRVYIVGTRDVDGRLRKFRSDQGLKRLSGDIVDMAEKFHAGKLVFEVACRCEDVDVETMVGAWRKKLEDGGYKVYGAGVGPSVVVFDNRWRGLLERVVWLVKEGGIGEEEMRMRIEGGEEQGDGGARASIVGDDPGPEGVMGVDGKDGGDE